ncbi:MAG: hypothetical protein LAO08_17645 [Acidobacteriia bacterium]|nr:hypothetical protein [Terriglobia bacterium]
MKTKLQTIAIVLAFSLLPALRATTLARLSLDQLAAAADSVARVRCVGAESRWENGAIWTVTMFDVIETLKGSLPAQVAVRLPGGKVGHLTAAVDGTPKFSPGEQAVVFLERARTGGYSVAGWVEGTFRIAEDPVSRSEIVTQDSCGFVVFDAATRTFRAEGVRKMPMDLFHARVAAAIARAQEKSR